MDIVQLEREMLGDLWVSPEIWDNLTYLCDVCNARFAGTDDERRAGDYLLALFQLYGLDNIAAEPFEMRGWERGQARLTVRAGGQTLELPCIALPGSPGCEVEAEVVDVKRGINRKTNKPPLASG